MFSQETHAAFRAHCLAEYPKEACGFVVTRHGVEQFVPMENAHKTPDRMFLIKGEAHVALAKEEGTVIKALLHSHVKINGKKPYRHPSKDDMALQIFLDMPFGISLCDGENWTAPFYFGEGTPRPPLIGRTFTSGVNDCLCLLRDYFAPHGVIVPRFAYGLDWHKDEDLYATNFTAAGFEQINARDVTVGDVALMKLGAKVYNHAGVVSEPDLLLHHMQRHLSMREPLQRWAPTVDLWLRHKDFRP